MARLVHWAHSNATCSEHSMGGVGVGVARVAMGARVSVMLAIVGRGTIRVVTLLLQSEVDITSLINVLNLLSIQFILLNVMSVVIEWVSNSIDLTFDLFLNFGLRIDLPNLSKLLSQLEVYTTCHEGVTTSLMHRSDSVNVEFFGYCLETTREIKLPLDLFAIVVVDEVGV